MRLFALGLASVFLAACGGETSPTDTSEAKTRIAAAQIFTSGTIYTGNGMQTVDTVAVAANNRIVWTGSIDDLDAEVEHEDAAFTYLNNAFMYPGFTDSHAHLLGIGQREMTLNLEGTASVDELTVRIEAEAWEMPEGQVLFGRGWIETGWPEGRMPNAADLDGAAPNNPVILVRADGHALVANTAAMVAAGVSDATPDVPGGSIERDANGQATGIFIDNSMNQILNLVERPTDTQIEEAYIVGATEYASRGWTGVHNMSVSPTDAPLMAELDRMGQMPLRLHNNYDRGGFGLAANRRHETDTITNRSVKVYMDGALGSRGALLIEPYADRPQTRGLSLMEPEALEVLMNEADTADVQLAIHAIGDLANRRILDTFEAGGFSRDKRWRIEHTQVLHPDDIARVGELGLIASMQPSHAIGDLKFAPDRLGVDRLVGAYAWQSLLATGATVVGGSDAPVEIGTPQIEFYAAVARKDLEGFSTEDWGPEEALSREDALALFTSAPAYAAFMENDLGTIEVGKIADFSVFDRDLMTVPEAEILLAQPVMTVVQGEVILARGED